MNSDYEAKQPGYFGNTRPDIAALVPVGVRRLLDIGCGEGGFGARLAAERTGLEVWGVEQMPGSAAVAASRLTRVISGGVESALSELPDGYFDCITFNDVLEHLVDPWAILRALRPKVTADGILLASIPNLRHFPVMMSLLLKGDFRYAVDGVLDKTHLRFFTKQSMQRLLEESGYAVTRMQGLQWTRFPLLLNLVNQLSARSFEDMHYLQFAVEARPVST